MGKDVLKSPGVVLRCRLILIELTLVLIPFIGVMSLEAQDIQLDILKDLNMSRVPSIAQLNISQSEFETKHREYFDLLEQNQRRRLNSTLNSSFDEENIVRKKLYRFTHSGLENSRAEDTGIENEILKYDIYIPSESNNSMIEVEETSIRLLIVPKFCATEKQRVKLEIVKANDNVLLKKDEIEADDCLPKWISVDLTDGFSVTEDPELKVLIKCEECSERNLVLTDPYLNVIVNVKSRLRYRRAPENRKRRRYPGKCGRHPMEVVFADLPGYKFVIQPRKFDAGICAGRCPKTWNPASRHSTLQYLLNHMDKRIPKPCCAPSKMEELEILHPDEDDPSKLKVSVWENTKIIECACS